MEDTISEKRVGTFKENYLQGYVNRKFINFIENSPEQIGAFIMTYGLKGDIIIVDLLDITIIKTMSIFIDKCYDQGYLLKYLQPLMIELQTGKRKIKYIPPKSKDTEDYEGNPENYPDCK